MQKIENPIFCLGRSSLVPFHLVLRLGLELPLLPRHRELPDELLALQHGVAVVEAELQVPGPLHLVAGHVAVSPPGLVGEQPGGCGVLQPEGDVMLLPVARGSRQSRKDEKLMKTSIPYLDLYPLEWKMSWVPPPFEWKFPL